MPVFALSDGYDKARESIRDLSRQITEFRAATGRVSLPLPHAGTSFEREAVLFAHESHALEKAVKPAVIAAAQTITELCSNPTWLGNSNILRLWHELALEIAQTGDHPDAGKRVASLAHDRQGNLLASAPSRIPEGVPPAYAEHGKGNQSSYRECSEIILHGRLLNIPIDLPARVGLRLLEHQERVKDAIQTWHKTVVETARRSSMLRNLFIHVTVCRLAKDAPMR